MPAFGEVDAGVRAGARWGQWHGFIQDDDRNEESEIDDSGPYRYLSGPESKWIHGRCWHKGDV